MSMCVRIDEAWITLVMRQQKLCNIFPFCIIIDYTPNFGWTIFREPARMVSVTTDVLGKIISFK